MAEFNEPFSPLKQGLMTTNTRTEHKRDPALENFAFELTQAVYPIVRRPRPKGSWLDLELNLWRVLDQTIQATADANPL